MSSHYPMNHGPLYDASKVLVSGPGIHDGTLSNYQSAFLVETGRAGKGKLNVAVQGPKHAKGTTSKCSSYILPFQRQAGQSA